jgi:acyl-coenzyme A synthetase/AMP-(fatty) acid ligase
VPYWVSRSPDAFYRLLCEQGVTVLNQTPSAFRQLIRAEEAIDSLCELSLRLVIFGGEALDLPSLNPWFERHGDRVPQMVNMYGITETTVHVTYRLLTAADARGSSGSVIGIQLPDLQAYLLDKHMHPVPPGVAGEIYIGGEGLSRGYLNRADLTAQAFVPDPFSNQHGARLYRSGDLARFLPNGEMQYFGRIDHQVKIRGFRIELGEIESLLSHRDDISEVVVMVQEEAPDNKTLVDYFIAASGSGPTATDLRDYLKTRLPDYMVPSAFIKVDMIPLTTNGKVHRRALSSLYSKQPDSEQNYVAPRSELEETLVRIWRELLKVDRVGVHDNFFGLGGQSVLAAQLNTRLNKEFNVHLPLRKIFEEPTVANLAQALTEAQATSTQLSLPVLQKASVREAEDLSANLDDLSDEDVDSLLQEILEEGIE